MINGRSMGCININAANVVIRNSRITCTEGVHWGVNVQSGNVTVEDTTVDCVNNSGTGFVFNNYVARRVHVQRCENGFHAGSNTTIVDSYITGVVEVNGGHGDGIQASSGSNILIQHNTFDLRNPITSSIIMANLTMTNMTVRDNFFAAGAYTVYCPAGSGITYQNNRFYGPVGNWQSDTHRPAYGYKTGCSHGGITWTGNYRDDTLGVV